MFIPYALIKKTKTYPVLFRFATILPQQNTHITLNKLTISILKTKLPVSISIFIAISSFKSKIITITAVKSIL